MTGTLKVTMTLKAFMTEQISFFLEEILILLSLSMLMILRFAILWAHKGKKNKVTAVYWALADVPALLRSLLTSMLLAVLCKAEVIAKYKNHC